MGGSFGLVSRQQLDHNRGAAQAPTHPREESRLVELNEADKAKTWGIVDTNFFLEYRFFDQVDWDKELELPRLMLVVPMAVLSELERFKSVRQREERRKRARQVLPRLEELGFGSRTPVQVRAGVELLLDHHEPQDLGSPLADDRIIASALEFRWTHRGAQVVVNSGDRALRWKAHSKGLQQLALPDGLEEPRPGAAARGTPP